MEEFQFVNRRKAFRPRFHPTSQKSDRDENVAGGCTINKEHVLQKVHQHRYELLNSSFYKDLKDRLRGSGLVLDFHLDPSLIDSNAAIDYSAQGSAAIPRSEDKSSSVRKTGLGYYISELVCYGVGNFASCVIASYQMSLLCLMRDLLGIQPQSCVVYDPAFVTEEQNIVQELGCHCIRQNEEGKRKATRDTVFFMPHCGKALYNNLLWANWDPGALQHLVIVGNSFNHMYESTPSRILDREAQYVVKILPYTTECEIPNSFTHCDIFNNLSIHTFKLAKLRTASNEFWANPLEPEYIDDVEITLNKSS